MFGFPTVERLESHIADVKFFAFLLNLAGAAIALLLFMILVALQRILRELRILNSRAQEQMKTR